MTRGDDRRDPLIALRIPPALDQRLRREAADTGLSLSEIVRSAIEHRIQGKASTPPPRAVSARPTTARSVRPAKCAHRVNQGNYCRRCEGIV